VGVARLELRLGNQSEWIKIFDPRDWTIFVATERAPAIDNGGNECLLARVILVKRANAHARHFSDAIGAGFVETLPDQNASSRFDQRVNRRARSRLRGVFPGFRGRLARHVLRSECE